jgi:hypothetical protein
MWKTLVPNRGPHAGYDQEKVATELDFESWLKDVETAAVEGDALMEAKFYESACAYATIVAGSSLQGKDT